MSSAPSAHQASTDRVRSHVSGTASLPPHVDVDDAISAVMCTLTERLTAGQAFKLLEALPKGVRPFFEICVVHREGRLIATHDRPAFLARVADHLGITPAHAELLCGAVFEAVKDELPDEVIANVAQQLPRGLQEMWLAGPAEPPPGATLSSVEARRAIEEEIARGVELPRDVTSADAFAAVMCALSMRLSGGEARSLLLALPDALRSLVDRCMLHRPEPSAVFGRDALLRRVADHVGMDLPSAERLVRVTFAALGRLVSEHAVDDVASQLPVDLRELWLGS